MPRLEKVIKTYIDELQRENMIIATSFKFIYVDEIPKQNITVRFLKI